MALVGVALVIGLLAVINVFARLSAPGGSEEVPGASASALASTLYVANTDGIGAYVRRTPDLADRLRPWPDNTPLIVIGADATVGGLQWKRVQDPAGNQGWIPAQYTSSNPLR